MRTAAFWGIPSLKKRNQVNDAFRRMAGFNCHSRALCVLLVLGGLTSSAFAAVEHVRDIVIPDYQDAPPQYNFATTQSPFDSGGTNVLPYLARPYEYVVLDVSEGEFVWPTSIWGSSLHISIPWKVSWVGQSSTGPNLIAIGGRYIFTYNIMTFRATSVLLKSPPGYFNLYSVAALNMEAPVSFIADTKHYTVDRLTELVTEMPLFGVDTATAHYMSYGADGLLYVLDYGNMQMDSFDPIAAFAPVTSFNLNTAPETVTANQQFAIGINGSFYLADGLGGGSYYSKSGAFLGTFALPGDAATAPFLGESFINTDAAGNIFVYDQNTGLHQYHDASVVPEPSTWALVGLGALVVVFRRRGQRA